MITSPLLRGGRWSWAAIVFFGIVGVQAIINISLASYLISCLATSGSSSSSSKSLKYSLYIVYHSGFIVAQVFSLVLAGSALHFRSGPLISAATAFDLLLLAFQIAQIVQTRALLHVVAIQATSIVVLVLGCVGKVWVAYRYLQREFGWQVYRALGADLKMQRMFLWHQVLLTLAIVYAFLFLEQWLQLVTITVQTHGVEGSWVENILVIMVCGVLLCINVFSAIQEFQWLMYGCVVVWVSAPTYFIYKLAIINSGQGVYLAGRKYLTFFLVLLLVLDMVLAVVSVIVAQTFGKGLRQRLRQFQILSRKEVDLEAIVATATATTTIASSLSSIHETKETHGLFSSFITSAKSTLKESSVIFSTYYSGLRVRKDSIHDTETARSMHREEVQKWEETSPGVANPQLFDIFESPDNRTRQGRNSLASALSIEELNVINGNSDNMAKTPPLQALKEEEDTKVNEMADAW